MYIHDGDVGKGGKREGGGEKTVTRERAQFSTGITSLPAARAILRGSKGEGDCRQKNRKKGNETSASYEEKEGGEGSQDKTISILLLPHLLDVTVRRLVPERSNERSANEWR